MGIHRVQCDRLLGSPFILESLKRLINHLETTSPRDFNGRFFREVSSARIDPDLRNQVTDCLYNLVRWRRLLDHAAGIDESTLPELSGRKGSADPALWQTRLQTYLDGGWAELVDDASIPPDVRVSLPAPLFDRLAGRWGHDRAMELGLIFNEWAPLYLRVNPLKANREDVLAVLKKRGLDAQPAGPALAIRTLNDRFPIHRLPLYIDGVVEVQDESTQIVAESIDCRPNQRVLDYCAGAGGKSLAIAHRLKRTATPPSTTFDGPCPLVLHDVREESLHKAHARLSRAGVEDFECITPDRLSHPQQAKRMRRSFDWVICDVPCSNTGTLRKHPEYRWLFAESELGGLVKTQREIVERAVEFVKPTTGRLVYSTCAITEEENEQQIEYFTRQLGLDVCGASVACDGQGGVAMPDDDECGDGEQRGEGVRNVDGDGPIVSFSGGVTHLPVSRGRDGFFFCVMRTRDR
ncbi:unnamed protein product [Vitrella brassicaformis CCMP3155]|uniref:SAM-dependent MTase RsmB/NOP-type domain-containing protein n=2 Tax=Vitrella brassicaformis TaxID=1169539 RepID=A0A0G4G134_VITBC|nr:unnamed protein product [Vitrella brassicaformis CCMP3155]|eukprot:CEM21696.1 unnamed protein product [Vitrella brassicaformis CCMP3155]